MSDYDDWDDAGQAEAEHWDHEQDYQNELAITQHLEEQEANEDESRRRRQETVTALDAPPVPR